MSKPIELHELNKSFGVVRNGIDGRCEPPDAVQALEQIAIQFNLWRSERAAMLECIAELAGALSNIGPTLDAMHDEWCEALDLPPHQPTLEEIERAKTALTRAAQFFKGKPE